MYVGYGDVYVASSCLQSNFGQAVKAMAEAERYPGVSLMITYAPCAMHGIEGGMCNALDDAKEATDTGEQAAHWRYNCRVRMRSQVAPISKHCLGPRSSRCHRIPQLHNIMQ